MAAAAAGPAAAAARAAAVAGWRLAALPRWRRPTPCLPGPAPSSQSPLGSSSWRPRRGLLCMRSLHTQAAPGSGRSTPAPRRRGAGAGAGAGGRRGPGRGASVAAQGPGRRVAHPAQLGSTGSIHPLPQPCPGAAPPPPPFSPVPQLHCPTCRLFATSYPSGRSPPWKYVSGSRAPQVPGRHRGWGSEYFGVGLMCVCTCVCRVCVRGDGQSTGLCAHVSAAVPWWQLPLRAG